MTGVLRYNWAGSPTLRIRSLHGGTAACWMPPRAHMCIEVVPKHSVNMRYARSRNLTAQVSAPLVGGCLCGPALNLRWVLLFILDHGWARRYQALRRTSNRNCQRDPKGHRLQQMFATVCEAPDR